MLYLRAGDLVYEQGTTQDHCGFASGMGIYYIARGATTSVFVPGSPCKIRKSRKDREDEYFKELHRIRKGMLQALISKKRLARKIETKTENQKNGSDDKDENVEDDHSKKRGPTSFYLETKMNGDNNTDITEKTTVNNGIANILSMKMKNELTQSINMILSETTEGKKSLTDEALSNLCNEIPGLNQVLTYFNEKMDEKKLLDENKSSLINSAEEDYVRTMLAPSKSFREEMLKHGADTDGNGHITQAEVDIYRQVQLLSTNSKEKVDMLDTHYTNHMFGEYEVMSQINKREHCVECQGVVIAFYIHPEQMFKLCSEYPCLEEEMWKRAAVTAAKLRLTKPPHDYRHRFTRDLRIAFQEGRVSSPVIRNSEDKLGSITLDHDLSETITLKSKDDHIFFLRTNYRPAHHHHHHHHQNIKSSKYIVDSKNIVIGRDHQPIISGPNKIVKIQRDEVAIIYTLNINELKRGHGFHTFPDEEFKSKRMTDIYGSTSISARTGSELGFSPPAIPPPATMDKIKDESITDSTTIKTTNVTLEMRTLNK